MFAFLSIVSLTDTPPCCCDNPSHLCCYCDNPTCWCYCCCNNPPYSCCYYCCYCCYCCVSVFLIILFCIFTLLLCIYSSARRPCFASSFYPYDAAYCDPPSSSFSLFFLLLLIHLITLACHPLTSYYYFLLSPLPRNHLFIRFNFSVFLLSSFSSPSPSSYSSSPSSSSSYSSSPSSSSSSSYFFFVFSNQTSLV